MWYKYGALFLRWTAHFDLVFVIGQMLKNPWSLKGYHVVTESWKQPCLIQSSVHAESQCTPYSYYGQLVCGTQSCDPYHTANVLHDVMANRLSLQAPYSPTL